MKPFRRISAFIFAIATSAALALIMLANLSCTKEGPAGPAGPPGSDGWSGNADLSNPAIIPDFIATVPANGSTGPYPQLYAPGGSADFPHFVAQFNKFMNTDIAGGDPGAVRITGFGRPARAMLLPRELYIIIYNKAALPKPSTLGPFDDVLGFAIVDSLSPYRVLSYEIGKSYTVKFDTSLRDINGNRPAAPLTFTFEPEPQFRVTTAYPPPGETNSPVGSTPRVVFNSVVDASILSSLHLSPAVPGTWLLPAWDQYTALFLPNATLDFNAPYTITVDAGAHDTAGHALPAAFTSSFRTSSGAIVATSPPNGAVGVPPLYSIQVNLGMEADTASERAAFSISPPVAGWFQGYPTYFYLIPGTELAPATKYTVTISTALASTGGVHPQSPYVFSFTTDNFRVTSFSPSSGMTDVGRSYGGYAAFNAPVDSATVRGAFHISPSVPLSFYIYTTEVDFSPSGQLAAQTVYTITIDQTLTTKGGAHLAAPFQASFRTGSN